MKMIYKKFELHEDIPVKNVLNNKKLLKYFNREAALGIFSLAELLKDTSISPETPIYYETGINEYEDFGLNAIVDTCLEDGKFSPQVSVERGLATISPLTQFKILLNMPLCFFSIENNLNGDNAVIYSSASGLLSHLYLSEAEESIIIGSGKVNHDGSVESGFALIHKDETFKINETFEGKEGIEIFRYLNIWVKNA